MAVAIMGGLIVATALTLLSLPAMYAIFFSVQLIIVLCHFSQDACPIVIFLTQAAYP
jgi:hypothetical protein